jgi:hypothetical protein
MMKAALAERAAFPWTELAPGRAGLGFSQTDLRSVTPGWGKIAALSVARRTVMRERQGPSGSAKAQALDAFASTLAR